MSRRKSKQWDKKTCEVLHAKKRFRQRYGIIYNKAARRTMENFILDGRAELVEKQSNTRYVLRMPYSSTSVTLIWDDKRKTIVTCLRVELMSSTVDLRKVNLSGTIETF